jgi:putative tryptophan/tyrosine transport system permease protein
MAILLAMQGAVSQGVLWGIMTLGLFITFKILDFADMTVDGSFALGGAVSAVLIAKLGMDPYLSLLVAFVAGGISGLATGLLHTKLKIPGILAGILTMIALYSINIRIMGQANTPLLNIKTMLTPLEGLGLSKTIGSLIIGSVFSIGIVFIMYWFFGTEVGSVIRATGNNERMVRAQGVDTDRMKNIGLSISNALVAFSGAMVAQSQGYADVGMGTGTIVIGLASIIIGEVIFRRRLSFWYRLLAAVLGSVIYRVIIAVVLQLGLKSTDLKLLTAVIVALALGIPVFKKNMGKKTQRREDRSSQAKGEAAC